MFREIATRKAQAITNIKRNQTNIHKITRECSLVVAFFCLFVDWHRRKQKHMHIPGIWTLHVHFHAKLSPDPNKMRKKHSESPSNTHIGLYITPKRELIELICATKGCEFIVWIYKHVNISTRNGLKLFIQKQFFFIALRSSVYLFLNFSSPHEC